MKRILTIGLAAIALILPSSASAALPPKPAKSCVSGWCEKVRDVRAVTIRVQQGFAQFARLRGEPSPLAAKALSIVRAARAQGRSPFALLSISGKESTFGLAQHCPEWGGGRFNTTGLGACGYIWRSYTFCGQKVELGALTSYADGFRVTGMLIRCLLPKSDTVWELYGYCEDCSEWGGDVHAIGKQYFRSEGGVRWEHALKDVGR